MPQYPRTAPSAEAIRGSVFTALAEKLATFQGEVFPFHVGDTWRQPPEGCRMEDLNSRDFPELHRYTQPQGMTALLEALSVRLSDRTGVATDRSHLLITTGATGGLGAIAGTLLRPGDEVLILAPYWPLIEGIVRSFHGTPVIVPFIGSADSAETAVECVAPHLTAKTVALYLNTPNNPTGAVIPRPWLEALVAWAQANDLWIIADEVYEDLLYRGEHTYCRSLAPERCLSSFSFSKAFGMAGNRCGYVAGPPKVMTQLQKIGTHTFYSTPTASQLAALRLLEDGRGAVWLRETKAIYSQLGDWCAARLGVESPAGSTFLFVDVGDRVDERGLEGFLLDCAEAGIFLAPGPSFGPYPTHARLCFTASEPAITRRGVDRLAELLSR